MSALKDYKQSVIDELRALNYTVYAGAMMKQNYPYIQVYPQGSYITGGSGSVSTRENTVRVSMNITIVAGLEDKDSSWEAMDEMISKCWSVVRNLDGVEVETFPLEDRNGGRLLVANIGFSNEINIYEGDL
ncbi:hypothetical protein [Rhodococcus sp. 05-2255-1e]|uniref:hypothetical protein n=1 Tax=Rhodococcus sp. 05-2255-1e TaxID=2022495 RepID=UPI001179A778|nr:hypothetical protein [Rhodococcus sp. 05-2255-1e]